MDGDASDLCLSRLKGQASCRGRRCAGSEGVATDLEGQDRDGFAASRPDRTHSRLSSRYEIPHGRQSSAATSYILAEELERLHDLLVRGAISQTEFDGLKAKLLGGAPSLENVRRLLDHHIKAWSEGFSTAPSASPRAETRHRCPLPSSGHGLSSHREYRPPAHYGDRAS